MATEGRALESHGPLPPDYQAEYHDYIAQIGRGVFLHMRCPRDDRPHFVMGHKKKGDPSIVLPGEVVMIVVKNLGPPMVQLAMQLGERLGVAVEVQE